jgi:peptidoglycan/xylan/chitin deacetylase (PgdA/CDA1 family)
VLNKTFPAKACEIRVLRVHVIFLALCGLSACAPFSTPSATPTAAPGAPVVTLTFDDGNADNFPVVALLQQYRLRATFYIPSGLVGHNGFMTWEQLRSVQAAGNEIGGHSLDHVTLSGLDTTNLRHEVCDDRRNLTDHGFNPISFAYPFGNYNAGVKNMVKQCGYLGARTVHDGPQPLPLSDPYAARAFPYVVSDTHLGKLQRYVNGTRQDGGGWVILVFHHVCDSCDYFSVRPDEMNSFVRWLAEQRSLGRVVVKTFAEMLP